jgi:hypothetical protein
MKRVTRNPYLIFPLGAALVMAALACLSFIRGEAPGIDASSVGFLVLLPLIAAAYSFLNGEGAKAGPWILRWLGTTILGIVASVVTLFASIILIPPPPHEAYNYAHFHFASYESGQQRHVSVGEQALDETLSTLEQTTVGLSDLWKERPIVLEFGSVT